MSKLDVRQTLQYYCALTAVLLWILGLRQLHEHRQLKILNALGRRDCLMRWV